MSDDELRRVARIGPPLPRMTFPCRNCWGTGWCETGFAFGSNVGVGHPCRVCGATGLIWADVPIPIGEAIR